MFSNDCPALNSPKPCAPSGVHVTIPAELKLSHIPRGCRPRCGAMTRSGEPCRAQALATGFCAIHSGLIPGGPSSPEAKARQAAAASENMRHLWATRWVNGRPLSPEGRARISEAQKRRSPESRYPSEETRKKISEARRRFEAQRRQALEEG